MSVSSKLLAFSKNGEYLAYSSSAGCLKIWESSTGALKQEYTPSSHLSATCSSLAWGPLISNQHASKKMKKSKNNAVFAISELKLLAMGTRTGGIFLYSIVNADIHTSLRNGHKRAVNDIVWYSDELYSCSNDQHIIIWDVSSGKIKTKWKANTGPIYSISVIDNNNLLTANTSIQWWDVSLKIVKKTFLGHSTEIFRLFPFRIDEESYVLSSASKDRVLNLWQLDNTSNKSASASFVLSDVLTNIDILVNKDEPIQISAVSQDGLLHFYEHSLNDSSRKLSKPLQSKFTMQIASKAITNSKPTSLPIYAVNISDGLENCMLSYGNLIKPAFERIDISSVSENLFLIRDISKLLTASGEDTVTKVKQPVKPSNVKLLAPGHMTNNILEKNLKKRKKGDVEHSELPMEEKLKALDLNKTPKEALEEDDSVKIDSMVHLLLQGLQSKDIKMLDKVFSCDNDNTINNTLERVPIQSIFPLLQVLYERFNKPEQGSHPCLKWFTALVVNKLPYFMSCRDISEYLIPFDQVIAARKEVIHKLMQASGILKLLMSQASTSLSNATELPKPLLEYESESSEEEENVAEMSDSNEESENEDAHSSSSSSVSSEGSDSESEMED